MLIVLKRGEIEMQRNEWTAQNVRNKMEQALENKQNTYIKKDNPHTHKHPSQCVFQFQNVHKTQGGMATCSLSLYRFSLLSLACSRSLHSGGRRCVHVCVRLFVCVCGAPVEKSMKNIWKNCPKKCLYYLFVPPICTVILQLHLFIFVYALLIFAQLELNTIYMSETRGANLIALLLLFSHTHKQISSTHTRTQIWGE